MKFIILILFNVLISLPAFAEELSLVIEHPRKNNRQVVENKIHCHKDCQWTSRQTGTEQGTSSQILFSKNLRALHALIMSGQFPETKKLVDREAYVNITVSDEKKSRTIQLGHARHYKGDNLIKFKVINDLITKIEFNLLQEKAKR